MNFPVIVQVSAVVFPFAAPAGVGVGKAYTIGMRQNYVSSLVWQMETGGYVLIWYVSSLGRFWRALRSLQTGAKKCSGM